MGLVGRLLGRSRQDEGPYVFPLDRSQERHYPDDFEGRVYYWDIDKTYLATEFDSLKGLLSVPLEFAVDKRHVPGTGRLLRALRRGVPDGGPMRSNPLYFVSASPPQLRGVVQRKMELDGVEYDGITFKDQLGLLRARRLHAIRHHVGYKLSALLLNRRELPWSVRETCFGDDSETDALIYGLYADIVAGRLGGEALERTLRRNEVDPEDAAYVRELAEGLPRAELVERIYINLEKHTLPGEFQPWGRRVVPCYDTLQAALHLAWRGEVPDEAALDIAQDLVSGHRRTPLGVLRSALDLVERGLVPLAWLAERWPDLRRRDLVPRYTTLAAPEGVAEPEPEEPARDFVTPASRLALR